MKKLLFLAALFISFGQMKAMEEGAAESEFDPEAVATLGFDVEGLVDVEGLEEKIKALETETTPDPEQVKQLFKDIQKLERTAKEVQKSPLRERVKTTILRTEKEKAIAEAKALEQQLQTAEKVRQKLEAFGDPLASYAAELSRTKSEVRPLFIAMALQNPELVQEFIDSGIALDARDGNRNTPLHWAVKLKSLPIAQLLVNEVKELKADTSAYINTSNKVGETALHTAAQKNADNIAAFLINEGAQLNAQDIDGNAPLHYAALFNSFDIAKLLLNSKAEPHALNAQKQRPLDLAKNELMKQLLKQYNESESQKEQRKLSRKHSVIFKQ